jgi:hypothetical protein
LGGRRILPPLFHSADSAPYPPTTGGYQPSPPTSSHYPPQHPGASTIVATAAASAATAATISAEDERKQILEQEQIKRNSLESAVEDKVRRQVKQVLNAAQVNRGEQGRRIERGVGGREGGRGEERRGERRGEGAWYVFENSIFQFSRARAFSLSKLYGIHT